MSIDQILGYVIILLLGCWLFFFLVDKMFAMILPQKGTPEGFYLTDLLNRREMEKATMYDGLDRRRYVRFDIGFPTTLNLFIPSKTGIMKVVIDTETINISLNGMCVKIGFSDYIDIIHLIEAAKNKSGIDIGVEVLAEWKRFEALGKIQWFEPVDENHARMGMQLKSMDTTNRKAWNKILSSLSHRM